MMCRFIRHPIAITLMLICPVIFAGQVNGQASPLWGNLEPGSYDVGFRAVHVVDYSRSYAGEQGRPVQVAIWYPAEPSGSPMLFREYLELYLLEEGDRKLSPAETEANAEEWREVLRNRGSDATIDVDALLGAQTAASRDATVAAGTFPLVVYGAGGQGESFENSVLTEYLASHGFIVAAVPSAGPEVHKTTVDARGLEAEARDMEFATAAANDVLPQADLSRIGVMGWSWGGLAAALVQMRNSAVDAVLSLDGSMAMHPDKLEATAFSDFDRVRVPYMLMTTQANVDRVKAFRDRIRYGDTYLLNVGEIGHTDFSAYTFIAGAAAHGDSSSGRAYEAICRYALAFFELSLGEEPVRGAALPNIEEVSDGLIDIDHRSPLPLPPTQEEFFELIREEGVDAVRAVFLKVRERDSEYQLFDAFEMTVLAGQLFRDGRVDDALDAARLRIEAYPEDYLSYEWLANLLYRHEDWVTAMEYYAVAYGMLSTHERTADVVEELTWYEERMASVREQLQE